LETKLFEYSVTERVLEFKAVPRPSSTGVICLNVWLSVFCGVILREGNERFLPSRKALRPASKLVRGSQLPFALAGSELVGIDDGAANVDGPKPPPAGLDYCRNATR
jgi:hypothetical protein